MSKSKKWTPPTAELLAQPCTPTFDPVDIGHSAGPQSFDSGYCTTHRKVMTCEHLCAAKFPASCACEAA